MFLISVNEALLVEESSQMNSFFKNQMEKKLKKKKSHTHQKQLIQKEQQKNYALRRNCRSRKTGRNVRIETQPFQFQRMKEKAFPARRRKGEASLRIKSKHQSL